MDALADAAAFGANGAYLATSMNDTAHLPTYNHAQDRCVWYAVMAARSAFRAAPALRGDR